MYFGKKRTVRFYYYKNTINESYLKHVGCVFTQKLKRYSKFGCQIDLKNIRACVTKLTYDYLIILLYKLISPIKLQKINEFAIPTFFSFSSFVIVPTIHTFNPKAILKLCLETFDTKIKMSITDLQIGSNTKLADKTRVLETNIKLTALLRSVCQNDCCFCKLGTHSKYYSIRTCSSIILLSCVTRCKRKTTDTIIF